MLVDDPKDYEELHEMVLDQELCIHITEDMLTMSPDQSNGYSGTDAASLIYLNFELLVKTPLGGSVASAEENM